MTLDQIISSLKDQAQDKMLLADGDKDSIFTQDATALLEACSVLENLKNLLG